MAEIMDVIRSHLDRETLENLGERVGVDGATVQRVAVLGGTLGDRKELPP